MLVALLAGIRVHGQSPTVTPTSPPTTRPTIIPTIRPTVRPTVRPTIAPSLESNDDSPTLEPSEMPASTPTYNFTSPVIAPTKAPTGNDSIEAYETTIFTIAGTGTSGDDGDNGLATDAKITYPGAIAIDDSYNIYFCSSDDRIRKIDYSTGIITTIIDNGGISGFQQLDIDKAGNLYWAARNQTSSASNVYKMSAQGATSRLFSLGNVTGLAVDKNKNVYAADNYGNLIYKNNGKDSDVVVYVGTGNEGYDGDDGPATSASIGFCNFMHFDSSDNLYFTDVKYNIIRRVSSQGIITTIAGTANLTGNYDGDNIQATSARLNSPSDVVIDNSGNIYISDFSNNRVRKVIIETGVITTLVGDGNATSSGDGYSSTSASVNGPYGLALDIDNNQLYVTEMMGNRIRKVINIIESNEGNNENTPSSKPTKAPSQPSGVKLATFAPSAVHMITFYLYLTVDYWPYEYVPDSAYKALTGLFKDLIDYDVVKLDYSVDSSSTARFRDRKLLSDFTLDVTANITALTSKITSISSKFVDSINNNDQLVDKLNNACGCTDYDSILITFYGAEEYCVDANTPSAATCSYGKIKINPSVTSIADSAFYNQQVTGVDFGGKTILLLY